MRAFLPPALAGLAAVAGLVPAQNPKSPDVPVLISRLGSPDFAAREAATRELGAMPGALGPLREAMRDQNPEVARRAAEAFAALRKRLGANRLKRLPEYAKARQVDRFVEAMAAWPEAVTLDHRDDARVLARDILTWAGKEFVPKVPGLPIRDLDRTDPGVVPLTHAGCLTESPGRRDAVALSVDWAKSRSHLVANGGFVGIDGRARFVNADARLVCPEGGGGIWGGLFVCNGDITTDWMVDVWDGVALCSGDVRIGFKLTDSLVVAGGEITFAANMEDWARRHGAVFRPKEPKLAEFLKFYDCTAEGLHARAEDKAVVVTQVDAGKPFAAAGVQPGDRVVKVDGTPVRTVRELNRLLCRAEVGATGTATVLLARGDKGVEAAVRLADPPALGP